MHPEVISLQHIADWLNVSSELDGLDAAIGDLQFGEILELRDLLLTTIAKGLHRRIFPKEKKYSSLNKTQRREVREAGMEALSNAINEFGLSSSPDDFEDLVKGFRDIKFIDRVASIKAAVDEAVPGVLDLFSD